MLLEGHREEAIQGVVGADTERQRLVEEVIAQTQPKKITHGRLYARARLRVPIHAENQGFQVVRIVSRNRKPDVIDQARPRLVEQRERLSGRNLAIVGISTAAVIARGALLDVILGKGKIGAPYGGILGGC